MTVLQSIGITCIGTAMMVFGASSWRKKTLIENIPTSKIRSLAMGLVEIHGNVKPFNNQTLKSPFSNKDCVLYEYKIEEYRTSDKHSHWVTRRRGIESVPFYLQDNTGQVLVDPKGAQIDIPRQVQLESGFGRDPPKQVLRYLEVEQISYENLFGINKRMRFTESFVIPNQSLYIMGTADDNPYVKEGTGQKNEEDIMIQKGKNEKFFYISDKQEHKVIESLKIKTMLGIAIGGICIVFGIMTLVGTI